MGIGVSPDDASLVLRGFETLGVRLRHSEKVALDFAAKIEGHPLVDQVLHPGTSNLSPTMRCGREISRLKRCVQHRLQRRRLPPMLPLRSTHWSICDWGVLGRYPKSGSSDVHRWFRTVTSWDGPTSCLRLSIGLEDESELWADIERLLDTLAGQAKARSNRSA
jgi:cystathionine beta-lyase